MKERFFETLAISWPSLSATVAAARFVLLGSTAASVSLEDSREPYFFPVCCALSFLRPAWRFASMFLGIGLTVSCFLMCCGIYSLELYMLMISQNKSLRRAALSVSDLRSYRSLCF